MTNYTETQPNFTFPTYPKSLFEYKDDLLILQRKIKIWLWVYILLPIIWIAGLIFTLSVPPAIEEIALSFFSGFSLIAFIILICYFCKRSTMRRQQQDLIARIKITLQYLEFMRQGYDSKDSYRFTLEWWDRQKGLEMGKRMTGLAATCAVISLVDLFFDD